MTLYVLRMDGKVRTYKRLTDALWLIDFTKRCVPGTVFHLKRVTLPSLP